MGRVQNGAVSTAKYDGKVNYGHDMLGFLLAEGRRSDYHIAAGHRYVPVLTERHGQKGGK